MPVAKPRSIVIQRFIIGGCFIQDCNVYDGKVNNPSSDFDSGYDAVFAKIKLQQKSAKNTAPRNW